MTLIGRERLYQPGITGEPLLGLGGLFKRLFRQSSNIHARQDVAATQNDLIDLIDRFIDGTMRYPLEWDDFISWEQSNPKVEDVRVALGRYESWLFSGDRSQMSAYAYRAAEERNGLAALLGRAPRQFPFLDENGKSLIAGQTPYRPV